MIRPSLLLVPGAAALCLAFAAATPARAASFDCSAARTADEVAICRTPALSMRDTEMAALFYAYRKVPMMMGSNGARHDDAVAFLAERRACGSDVACLQRHYTARIAALKLGIDAAMQELFRLQNSDAPAAACPPPARR